MKAKLDKDGFLCVGDSPQICPRLFGGNASSVTGISLISDRLKTLICCNEDCALFQIEEDFHTKNRVFVLGCSPVGVKYFEDREGGA